ncbi:MAG: putative Zn-dependent protease [Candidatus Azotimanducaceae bacterium]|jgi:predicted Zn-dependent protease
MKPKMKSYLISFLIVLLLPGCAVNPVTGKNELSWVSESEQIRIGELQYGPSQQSQGGAYLADPDINLYVNEVGQKVAQFSPVKLPYEFVVLNNDTPNAWALPGGKIAVNRGLLLALKSEAELAAVLSHEIVHAAAKHGAQAMQRNTLSQGLLAATALVISQSDHKDYADYVVGSAQVGLQLISTRYGRNAELESDFYGIQYMVAAGYNPAAAVTLQKTFVQLSKNREQNWVEGLFASHPPSSERVKKNKETVSNLVGLNSGDFYAERYEKKLSHLRSAKDAYIAAKKAKKLASQNKFESALSTLSTAIKIEPNEANFYGTRGSILYQQKNYKLAEQAFTQALELNNNYFEYYLGRGLTRNQQGNTSAAQKDLKQSITLLPTAAANQHLGQIALDSGDRSGAKKFFLQAMGAQGPIGDYAKIAYLKLDIKDNPNRYLSAQLRPSSKGQLMIVVTNQADINIESLRFDISALIGQQKVNKTLLIRNLNAKSAQQYPSAWYVNESTIVENLDINITELALK